MERPLLTEMAHLVSSGDGLVVTVDRESGKEGGGSFHNQKKTLILDCHLFMGCTVIPKRPKWSTQPAFLLFCHFGY